MLTLAGGVGAGFGVEVLAQRSIASGVALADSLVLPVMAAGVTGLVAAGVTGYEVGKAINEIPGVHSAAVSVVGAAFDAVNWIMSPKPPSLPDYTPPSFSEIANTVSYNSSEATYTSSTDIVGLMAFGSGHDTSALFLWP